jgi:hypothetical protein
VIVGQRSPLPGWRPVSPAARRIRDEHPAATSNFSRYRPRRQRQRNETASTGSARPDRAETRLKPGESFMLIVIGVVVALICFHVSSWPFRLVYIGVPAAYFGCLSDVKLFHSTFAAAEGRYFTSIDGIELLWTLPSLYIGAIVLGTTLGIVRKSSGGAEQYKAARLRFFKSLAGFGLKWGVPYFAFIAASRVIINHVVDDPDMGWFITKACSTYFLAAYIVLALIVRSLWKRPSMKRAAPEISTNPG